MAKVKAQGRHTGKKDGEGSGEWIGTVKLSGVNYNVDISSSILGHMR